MANAPDPHAARAVLRLIFAFTLSRAVYAVAKLGVTDAMTLGEATPVEVLAEQTGANPDALYRIMRALAAEGLFKESSPRAFELTAVGELLREDANGTMRYHAMATGENAYRVWEHVLDAVRTGEPAAPLVFGKSHFEHLAENPEQADLFNRAMAGPAAARALTLYELDWSEVESVADIGGGTGGVLLRLLEREPHLRGVLFDLPHVADDASSAIARAGLGHRCSFVAGSFFDEVPAACDVYVLGQILHDWGDGEAVRILETCRSAAPEDARLIVLEQIVPPGDEPDPSKILDLQMLVMLGGRERMEPEYRDLLARGGWQVERVTYGLRASALEARPI